MDLDLTAENTEKCVSFAPTAAWALTASEPGEKGTVSWIAELGDKKSGSSNSKVIFM